MAKLTAKQNLFVEEYLIDLNATQAAIRAGYSEKTAKSVGSENLTKPDIAELIEKAKAKRSEKTEIDAAWVLRKAVELHDRCMQATQVVTPDGEASGEYKFDAGNAARALDIVGKHVGVQAFLEKKEVKQVGLDESSLLRELEAISKLD